MAPCIGYFSGSVFVGMFRFTEPSVGCPRDNCLHQSNFCFLSGQGSSCSNIVLHRGFASLHPFWGRSGFIYTDALWRLCTLLGIACFSLKLSYPGGGGAWPVGSCVHSACVALLCLRSKGSRCFNTAVAAERSLLRCRWRAFLFSLQIVLHGHFDYTSQQDWRLQAERFAYQAGSCNAVVFRTRQQTLA